MRQGAQPRWQRIRRSVGLTLALAGLIVSIGVAARAWSDTRDETDRTVAAVRETRDELARAGADLDTATAQLEAARATLDNDLATLDARQSDRDAAKDKLAATNRLLADLEARLAAGTADLEERTARLQALGRCLVGVAGALNQAAVNDTDGLGATLGSIEDTCARAGAAL